MISKERETHSKVDKLSDTFLDGSSPKIQNRKQTCSTALENLAN